MTCTGLIFRVLNQALSLSHVFFFFFNKEFVILFFLNTWINSWMLEKLSLASCFCDFIGKWLGWIALMFSDWLQIWPSGWKYMCAEGWAGVCCCYAIQHLVKKKKNAADMFERTLVKENQKNLQTAFEWKKRELCCWQKKDFLGIQYYLWFDRHCF